MSLKNEKETILLSDLEIELLRVLYGQELYGLTILEQINQIRRSQQRPKLSIGSLMPTLKDLSQAELIEGIYREQVAGKDSPRRKYYHLPRCRKICFKQH